MLPLYDINPAKNRPRVTRALIVANVVVFILSWLLERQGVSFIAPGYGLVPIRLTLDPRGEWFTVFSSMFLHAGIGHIGWNMLFLHIFGDNVEDKLGSERFLLFYLLAGLGAALGQYLMNPYSPIPMVGASGAIGGVLGGYLVLHPRAPVAVLNPIPFMWLFAPLLPLPAWLVVGEWFVVNVAGVLSAGATPEGAGVAFAAHLGGFLFGLLSVRLFARQEALERAQVFRQREPGRPVFWRDDKQRPFWK